MKICLAMRRFAMGKCRKGVVKRNNIANGSDTDLASTSGVRHPWPRVKSNSGHDFDLTAMARASECMLQVSQKYLKEPWSILY